MTQLVEIGALIVRPVVDAVFPLDGLADAQRSFEASSVRGEHVIHLLQPS